MWWVAVLIGGVVLAVGVAQAGYWFVLAMVAVVAAIAWFMAADSESKTEAEEVPPLWELAEELLDEAEQQKGLPSREQLIRLLEVVAWTLDRDGFERSAKIVRSVALDQPHLGSLAVLAAAVEVTGKGAKVLDRTWALMARRDRAGVRRSS